MGDTTIGDIRISTVFLGVDHRFVGEGKPVLFETMIFNHGNNEYQRRYCTWAEAEVGHMEAIELLQTQLQELSGASVEQAAEIIRKAMAR